MPRNNVSGSTLRNRNRITNKSRLRVLVGSHFESDIIVGFDDQDDKNRMLQQTAGVDAEDANEHHLQAVLSAAASSHKHVARKPNNASTEKDANAARPTQTPAYIPTPQAQGVADEWQTLYPSNVWADPVSFACSSTTAEEAITAGLNDFTYYMDERDKEWLDRNNEEARGEGTSAQGALSPSSGRPSRSSTKAKGKEPDVVPPVGISEDIFELVMGLFEKITHEKREFLHHSFEPSMIPAFSEYQATFGNELPVTIFADYAKPSWVPKPHILLRISQIIYPHWRERRVDRQGNRIIPSLNFDESDTLNESYICFRRREIKSVRKTRASQVSSSDKLSRLKTEMGYPLQLARLVMQREATKRDHNKASKHVSDIRLAFADLKRKFPSLHDKTDEELLIDKERPVKRVDLGRAVVAKVKQSRDEYTPSNRPDNSEKPRERVARIQNKVDSAFALHKERNAQWEDPENIYQPRPAPYSQRLFRYYQPPSDVEQKDGASPVAARTRRGRGGRFLVDRRHLERRKIDRAASRSKTFPVPSSQEPEDPIADKDLEERLASQWRFDPDDSPIFPPSGAEEQDRVLVDEHASQYVRYRISWLGEDDYAQLATDSHFHALNTEGDPVSTVTYAPMIQQGPTFTRRTMPMRSYQPQQVQISQVSQANGPASVAIAQMRVAGVRSISALSQQSSQHQAMLPPPAQLNSSFSNGLAHLSTSPSPKPHPPVAPNNSARPLMNGSFPPKSPEAVNAYPNRPASADGRPGQVNGFHPQLSPPRFGVPKHAPMPNGNGGHHVNSSAPQPTPNGMGPKGFNIHAAGLSEMQVQNLKSAFATARQARPEHMGLPVETGYMGVPMGHSGMNKMPSARWAPATHMMNGHPMTSSQGGVQPAPLSSLHDATGLGMLRPQSSPSPIPSLTQSPPRSATTPSIQTGQNGL